MAIYAQPNSFFQLINPVNFNCVEPINICFPIFENKDLYGMSFITNDNPIVPPESEDDPNYPLVSYCFRTVRNCSEPIINIATIKHYNQFYYYDLKNGTWLISAVKYNIKDEPFTYNSDSFNVTPDVDFEISQYNCSECFFIQIIKTVRSENPDPEVSPYIYTNTVVACIGCFQKICDPCYTTKLFYFNNENAFGFKYSYIPYPPILLPRLVFQTIRLPFYLKEPQFPIKRNVFTLSNGDQKKLSSRIEKEWIAETDYMPKEWHEKLVIALEHDFVAVINTNSNIDSKIIADANYEIDWPSFLNYPMAKAKFKAKQIPYNNVNTNCI